MSKECLICGKKKMAANLISHSHRKTKTCKMPNLQKISLKDQKSNNLKTKNKSIFACAKCIKTMLKTK